MTSPILSSSATHKKNLNFGKFMRSFRMLRRQEDLGGYVCVMIGDGWWGGISAFRQSPFFGICFKTKKPIY